MSTQAEISDFIAKYLRDNGAMPSRATFETVDLFESGALDSLGAMRFAAAIEEHFNIELTDEDILSNDFRTAGGVIQLTLRAIARRQASAA